MKIQVDISVGEYLDKYSILKIKEEKDLDDLLLTINEKNNKPLIIDYKIDINISKERKEKLVESINKIIN